jgi:hypothetical protein
MHIYILNERDEFLKMTVITGNPYNGLTWEAKVFQKSSEGKWVFKQKVTFHSHLRMGTTFIVRDQSHVVARFYVPPII